MCAQTGVCVSHGLVASCVINVFKFSNWGYVELFSNIYFSAF